MCDQVKLRTDVDSTMSWFAGELDIITEALNECDPNEKLKDFLWPYSSMDIPSKIATHEANCLCQGYHDVQTKCALLCLNTFLDVDERNSDYLFMRLHILGHALLDKINYQCKDDVIEAAMNEVICLFFAACAMRHYQGMVHLGPQMAYQIAGALNDCLFVINHYNRDLESAKVIILQTCEKLFLKIVKRDLEQLQ